MTLQAPAVSAFASAPLLPPPPAARGAASDELCSAVAAALGVGGALACAQTGYLPRAGQVEMALAVAQAIGAGEPLVVEAGTGVGKTFAYLVPALLSSQRVVISTATKALQDQLFGRDLPHVLSALGLPMRTALLKGRASYLCAHRLQQARQQGALDALLEKGLADVERWAQVTRTGDLAELPQLDERSALAPMVSSTRENCMGAACAHLRTCHVNQARREALTADVVVVNHHLLFADMAVRESGVAELLPDAGVVVIDEAHQLNDIGLQFLGEQWGSAGLLDFARELLAVARPAALGVADWQALAARLEARTAQLHTLASTAGPPGRYPWTRAPQPQATLPDAANPMDLQCAQHTAFARDDDAGWGERLDASEVAATHAPEGIEPVWWFEQLREAVHCLHDCACALALACEATPALHPLTQRCHALLNQAELFQAPVQGSCVRWLELSVHGFLVVESPQDVAGALQGRLMRSGQGRDALGSSAARHTEGDVDSHRAINVSLPVSPAPARLGARLPTRCWVFTSATLGDDKSMAWFTEPCGLQGARALRVSSPFDYASQAALYVPNHAPKPSEASHSPWVATLAAEAAQMLGGRTLVLTTTLRALRSIGDALREQVAPAAGLEVLVQGQMPKRWLMERFREGATEGRPGCILVASASFWEGFDVPGESLQLVIIDKLPFPPPGDPLVLARVQRLEATGRNAFAHHAVPEAAVALRQGAGRLIRSESDRGILVVCDTRLTAKGYGKRLLRALPPMRQLRDTEDFSEALRALTKPSTKAHLSA